MKYVLAILCGAVVLFMGGCAVLTVQAMPLPLIPAGIAFLNISSLAFSSAGKPNGARPSTSWA